MNPRLAKEIRPLLWPFLIMAIAMVIPPWLPMTRSIQWSFPVFAWLLGAALLSICAFAFEHQERTLSLLLAQPIPRARIWWEKYRVLVPLILVPILVLRLSWPPRYGMFDLADLGVVSTSIAASLVSAPFWSGLALSVIGGFAFSVAAQLVGFVACLYLVEIARVFPDLPTAIGVVGLVYVLSMLALGWRFYGRSGQTATATRDEVESRSALQGALGLLTPRCRPRGRWLNLVRREICLQRSTLQLGMVALLLTAAILAVDLIIHDIALRALLDFLLLFPTFITSLGAALLAGNAALCEEKSLGTAAWSQLLPISGRSQYFVKVAVAAVMAGLIGIVGPFAVANFYALLVPTAFQTFGSFQLTGYYLAGVMVPFILSLNVAAALARSTLHGVLLTIATTVGAALASLPAVFLRELLQEHTLTRGTLLWKIAAAQTPFGPLPAVLAAVAILATAVRLLWSASGNFGRTFSRRSSFQIAAWCILLPAFAATVAQFFVLTSSAAANTQFETLVSTWNRLGTVVTKLDKPNPARVLGQTVTFNLEQIRAAGGDTPEFVKLFTDPRQQLTLEVIRLPSEPEARSDGRGASPSVFGFRNRQARVRFNPPLVLEENFDPRARRVTTFLYRLEP